MKNAFAIVTLSAALTAVLSGCALLPFHAREPEQAAPVETAAAPAAPEDPLPGVELSADLLFQLTRAELEFKSGQWLGPYEAMLGAARQTRDPRLAQRATEMALAAKQGGPALEAIRLWRELAPHSEDAIQYFLGFAVLGDQIEQAEPLFVQRLRDAGPAARGLAMFQMQQFLTRAKDKAVAFAMLERVLAPYDGTLEAHLVLAQGAFAAGAGERAVQEARRAQRFKPDSELALLTLAQVTPDPQAALALLEDFLARHENAREARTAYVRMLIEQKRYQAARDQFLLLQKGQPDNPATLYALGIVSMQLEDAAAAEGYFKQFLALLAAHPGEQRDPSRALLILSQIAEQRGDVDGAVKWIEQIGSDDEAVYFSARLKRAQLIARRGDLDGARKALAALKGADPEQQTRLLQAEAQLLREGGDSEAAFAVLEAAVKRFPDHAGLLYDFALAAEKTNRPELMEASLRRVMEQDPANHHAYNALGYSLAERNVRLPEARALIERALQMAPADPFIMDSMGWVQFRLGNLSEAEQMLRRAYALRADPEIAVHLGEVLWRQGEQAQAQQMWRDAQTRDPQNEALKSTLVRLNVSL